MTKVVVPVMYGKPSGRMSCVYQYPYGTNMILGGCIVQPARWGIIYRCKECHKEWEQDDCSKAEKP